jgi:putative glycosyltransferase (TIGR04372 family)
LWLNSAGRYLSFAEIYESGAAEYWTTEEYDRAGISIHDNSPEDILRLTEEVFLRSEGSWSQSRDGEVRQATFRKLIQKYCPYELSGFRIGDAFLEKYEFLL